MAHAARVGILALVASVMSVVSGKGTLWEPNPFFFFFFFPLFGLVKLLGESTRKSGSLFSGNQLELA